MRLEIWRYSIQIIPETEMDIAFLKDTLKIPQEKDFKLDAITMISQLDVNNEMAFGIEVSPVKDENPIKTYSVTA